MGKENLFWELTSPYRTVDFLIIENFLKWIHQTHIYEFLLLCGEFQHEIYLRSSRWRARAEPHTLENSVTHRLQKFWWSRDCPYLRTSIRAPKQKKERTQSKRDKVLRGIDENFHCTR